MIVGVINKTTKKEVFSLFKKILRYDNFKLIDDKLAAMELENQTVFFNIYGKYDRVRRKDLKENLDINERLTKRQFVYCLEGLGQKRKDIMIFINKPRFDASPGMMNWWEHKLVQKKKEKKVKDTVAV